MSRDYQCSACATVLARHLFDEAVENADGCLDGSEWLDEDDEPSAIQLAFERDAVRAIAWIGRCRCGGAT